MTQIPKTFYLTHSNHNDLVDKRISQIKTIYPEFNVKFYDNNACKKFLESNYPDDHIKTFLKLRVGAHKADFFRYCILYKNGGLYIDLDNVPQKNIWDLITKYHFTSCLRVATAPCYQNDPLYNKKHIHQGFIATESNSFILEHLIGHMIGNPWPRQSELVPMKYHFYVRYFYGYLLEIARTKELHHSTEYIINNKKIFLIDETDHSIMKYGQKN